MSLVDQLLGAYPDSCFDDVDAASNPSPVPFFKTKAMARVCAAETTPVPPTDTPLPTSIEVMATNAPVPPTNTPLPIATTVFVRGDGVRQGVERRDDREWGRGGAAMSLEAGFAGRRGSNAPRGGRDASPGCVHP